MCSLKILAAVADAVARCGLLDLGRDKEGRSGVVLAALALDAVVKITAYAIRQNVARR